MSVPIDRLFNPEDFHPQLREVFANPPMNPMRMPLIALPIEDPHKKVPVVTPLKVSRCVIDIVQGEENCWIWEVESLRGLFRGDRKPPALGAHPKFEAIMARLERSCRTFRMGLTSRNYIGTLRQTIGPLSK